MIYGDPGEPIKQLAHTTGQRDTVDFNINRAAREIFMSHRRNRDLPSRLITCSSDYTRNLL